ncbi:MAG: toprim domain-containing protein, partial [Anaerolineales bacterium]|nr:toprim domain-containing protein [Anaerolineales bacterium]
AIIVEGYMDVLTAHQHQIANMVASMGTALTETQLRLLKRFSKRFTLALDADTAGHQATLRSMALAQETLAQRVVPVPTARGLIKYESHLDIDIRIITLPQGQDPDKVIREDPALWTRLVENALPVVEYYFKVITSELQLDSPKGKAEAVRRLMPVIQEIGDAVERAHYIQKLARLVRVDEKTLLRQARAGDKGAKRRKKAEEGESLSGRERFTFGLEEYCISILLKRPYLLQSLDVALRDVGADGLSADDFAQAENRAIFASWRERLSLGDGFEVETCEEELDPALRARFALLLEGPRGAPSANDDQVEKDLVKRGLSLRRQRLGRLVEELRFLLVDGDELEEAETDEYRQMVNSYRNALGRIDQALGDRSFFGRREASLKGASGLVA